MTKLSRYIEKHERPYTIEVKNGKGKIQVLFYDGYVTIRSYQPGLHFATEIHIRRKAWLKLLSPQLVKVTRMMEGPSFDRYRAERRYYHEEAEQLEALRAQKAARDPQKRHRRRRRV